MNKNVPPIVTGEKFGDQVAPETPMDGLGGLSLTEYGAIRAGMAARHNLPLSFIDKEYENQRKAHRRESDPPKSPADTEPWPDEVNIGSVLKTITERLKSHVAFTDNQALVVGIWVVFTWAHDAFTHSPQLLVTSPEANSGKSTLLGLVNWLAKKGLLVINPSPAVMYR